MTEEEIQSWVDSIDWAAEAESAKLACSRNQEYLTEMQQSLDDFVREQELSAPGSQIESLAREAADMTRRHIAEMRECLMTEPPSLETLRRRAAEYLRDNHAEA